MDSNKINSNQINSFNQLPDNSTRVGGSNTFEEYGGYNVRINSDHKVHFMSHDESVIDDEDTEDLTVKGI